MEKSINFIFHFLPNKDRKKKERKKRENSTLGQLSVLNKIIRNDDFVT